MSKGNIRWHNKVCIKIVTLVILCCAIVLGGLGAYNISNAQKELTGQLEKLARVTSQRLARHLTGPMWDLDNDLVDSTLEAEMLEGRIQAIVVWDNDTKAVFSARERGPAGSFHVSSGAIVGDLIKSSSDVNNGEKLIGEVAVFVSKKELQQLLGRTVKSSMVTLFALTITILIVMTIVTNQIIVGPIKRLVKQAGAIGRGDLKQDIVAESRDEIGQMADEFRNMQANLRTAFKRIYAKTNKS